MTTKLILSSVILSATLCFAGPDNAAPTKKSSAEFERMKSLVGTWTGQADIGQGPVDMTVKYRLLAGGSVLEERIFPDSPMEMVTMYYEKEGKLALTHYCVIGNRPAMVLKTADDKTFKFEFDSACGIDTKNEMHMHAMTLRFDNPDTITTTCKSLANGQEQVSKPCTLKRVKV